MVKAFRVAACISAFCLASPFPVSAATTAKHMDKGVSCESCHKTSAPSKAPKGSVCNSCHNYPDLAKKTAGVDPNPHDNHAGELRCVLCHHEHKPSELYCMSCHTVRTRFPYEVP